MPNQPKNLELRIPYDIGIEIRKNLFETKKENVAIARVGGASFQDSYAVLINSMTLVPQDFLQAGKHGVSWPASFNVQQIDEAARLHLGLLILHSHGNQKPPKLSDTDRQNGTQVAAAFRTAIPKMPHGTVVFGENGSVFGLVWLPGASEPASLTHARWLSDPVRMVPPKEPNGYRPQEMYDRQKILLGEEGQKLLAASQVGIIGLGGGGSHVAQQLAYLGIGAISIVDYDRMEEVNRHRTIGSRPSDVKEHLGKVAVIRRLVEDSNPEVKVHTLAEKFPSENSLRGLKECDVIVGCVDSLHARRELQSFTWRYLIPYVDIGLIIQLYDKSLLPRRISGQVYDLIPGAACLWCSQLLSEDRLREESGGRNPSYMQNPQRAQVVSFNGVLASQAVSEVLHLITGYAARGKIPNALQFDGINGTLSPCILEKKPGCRVCSQELGYGDAVW